MIWSISFSSHSDEYWSLILKYSDFISLILLKLIYNKIYPSKIGTTEVKAWPDSTTSPVVLPVLNKLNVAEFINKTEFTLYHW